jgi:glutathione synthase/RimK-type ligase-like ATP-grasp enzyme
MSTQKIVIATCRAWPELSASDALLAEELTNRGHTVEALAWNVAPLASFTSADHVVLRSNWDYHHHLMAFDDWLAGLDKSAATLHNPATVVTEFNHKSYLQRLGNLGLPTPATLALDEFDTTAIASWMDDHDLASVVLKPAWGASGHAVDRASRTQLEAAEAAWRAAPEQRAVLAQEFIPEIAQGEVALVFFSGTFSHAFRRSPTAEDFRVNSQYGGTVAAESDVDPAAVALGARILSTLTESSTYARIDVVGSGSALRLMEVEVNEPALGLHLCPGAAARFADAILGEHRT